MLTMHIAKDARGLAKKIHQRLSESQAVRPFPVAVARLTTACHDPNADAGQFASIIECDPAMSVKILKMANSPLFCPSGEVKSIAHASSLLGLRRLKSLAMSVAAAEMFSSGSQVGQKERRGVWRHSLGCATVARALTRHISGFDEDQVFLAGVFHDIGKLFFLDAIPEEYGEVHSSCTGLQLLEVEQLHFGVTHERIGYLSAISWNLPEIIRVAIGWHHRPDEAEAFGDFVRVIHFADCLSAAWSMESSSQTVHDSLQACLEHYDLTVEQLGSIEVQARQTLEVAMDL